MTAAPLIAMRGVKKSFQGVPVLRGVDLEVHEGHTFVLLGSSGSGKTVLLKHLEGLIRPDEGSVIVDGHELSNGDPDELDAVHREVGIQFQSGALFDSDTVEDNVAFPLRELLHLKEREVRERVNEMLKLLGLSEARNRHPSEISGGMIKRVAFARAMVMKPRVLLADEPTAGLDPIMTETVDEAIEVARKQLGVTGFVITHDLPTAFRIADVVGLLHEGRVIEAAPPHEFRTSKHPAVLQFLKDWLEREAQARSV